ncbi:MBL fold metallo-hydrolase, partial [Chloroflexota bacterium]
MTQLVEAIDGIYRVEFDNPKAQENTEVYLVRGAAAAIIETGPAIMVPEILVALRLLDLHERDIRYTILTHLHLDHAGGAGQLARELPNTKIVVHQRGAGHLIDPRKLIEGTQRAFGADFEKEHGAIVPIASEQVLSVQGGETLDLGGRQLELVYTPGHAAHHLVILDRKTRGLFCGDTLGQYFPEVDLLVPVPALPLFNVEMTRESIEKIRRLKPAVLLFSHGGPRRDVERLIRGFEDSIDILDTIASEAHSQGLDAEQLSERLRQHDTKVMDLLRSPRTPGNVRH